MQTIHERLRHWREEVAGLSLRELQGRVNAELPPDAQLSLGTVANYEKPVDANGRVRPGPRSEFLVAWATAFPEARLEWLLFGRGEPSRLADRLAAPGGLEDAAGAASGGASTLAARVLATHPDLAFLSPEASALFMGTLTRYAMGEPDLAIDESRLIELAADLRWLVFAPFHLWGFRHAPKYEELSTYVLAMLLALGLALPRTGEGDAISDYADAANRRLRGVLDVRLDA